MENLKLKSVKEVLLFAIQQKDKAYGLYFELAKKSTKVEMRVLWEQLANDELKQKTMIESILDEVEKGNSPKCCSQPEYHQEELMSIPEKVYTEEEEALVMAINMDSDNMKMYRHLASKVGDAICANVLINLANHQLIHKKNLVRELNMFNYFG